jgi:hypothetical protein
VRVIVTGLVGQYPFGGVIWDYLSYAAGFARLGHDVYYLEDSGSWPYDPAVDSLTDDCSHQLRSLDRILPAFGLADRWFYRNGADGTWHGGGEGRARELLASADLLVNISGAAWLHPAELGVRHCMFLDGDPLFTQVKLCDNGKADYIERVRAHHSHFSFGLNLGRPNCTAPDAGIHWRPTLQPVDLDTWTALPGDGDAYSTVMNWVSYPPVEWNGNSYGQKNVEFLKYADLPRRAPVAFRLAMGQGIGRQRPTETLLAAGWEIVEPDITLPDHDTYRAFVSGSRAEWSIAKEGYVKARTGWFSCRTACYLAAGRPAVVQDTGWSGHLPHGAGLFAFTDLDSCLHGIREIEADYPRHRKAARALAEEYFDAPAVCRRLLRDAGLE